MTDFLIRNGKQFFRVFVLPFFYFNYSKLQDTKEVHRRHKGHEQKKNTFSTSNDLCTSQNQVNRSSSSLIIILKMTGE